MFALSTDLAVYVHRLPVDFRKSINGLAALVEQSMGLNAFSRACFVFCNRHRDKVKILLWERSGFWLLYKRLEEERFVWPDGQAAVIELSVEQLHWLLEGIDLAAMRAHRRLAYRRAS
jgi:transposase